MVYIALGSNQGNRFDYIQQAIYKIESKIGVIKAVSNIYETPAQGFEGDSFLNACIGVKTSFSPLKTLNLLLSIENEFGRKRNSQNRYTARPLDLDIILFSNKIINHPELKVPHPQMELRQFVLTPLTEIAASIINPKNGKSIEQIQRACERNIPIKKWSKQIRFNSSLDSF